MSPHFPRYETPRSVRRSRERTTAAIFLTLAVVLSFACRGHEGPRVNGRRLDRVTLNTNPLISYMPYVLAKERGYFAAEGIDPVFVTVDMNSAMLALLSGKLDVGSAPVGTGMFNMIGRGQRIQVVAERGHAEPGRCSFEAFVAPTGMAERIARAGSIRGERIATRHGGMMDYLVATLLEKQHLTSADVEYVQLPQTSDLPSNRRNTIEAIRYMGEPTLSAVLAKGNAKIVAYPADVAPGHITNVVLYGSRLLDRDPDLGRRFMRAYLRGVRDFNQGKTDANVQSVSRLTGLDPAVIRRSCWPTMSDDGKVTAQSMQPFLDWARKSGYLEKDVPMSAWWNPSFVEAAARPAPARAAKAGGSPARERR